MPEAVGPATRGTHYAYDGVPTMHMTVYMPALISLIAGILILIVPRLLNYIVALYLIIMGVVGLFH